VDKLWIIGHCGNYFDTMSIANMKTMARLMPGSGREPWLLTTKMGRNNTLQLRLAALIPYEYGE
jgi:hypothetical protein